MSNRNVLIVSPHFPPINAADAQRVRMSLPYLDSFGWNAHILTVDPKYIQTPQDPFLTKTVPDRIPITHVKALPIQQTQKIGLGSLSLRALPYLSTAGDRLLQQQKFDLVYISTTAFPTMYLGARWQKRFGVPYVLDFQDPWLSDYYDRPDSPPPPGGRLKYGFSQLQAKILEPKALEKVSHVISVSPTYPKVLQQRYPHLHPEQFSVLPFGAPESDFELLPALDIKQKTFDRDDEKRHWVYVGAVGKIMGLALRSLFLAIQLDRDRNPEVWKSIRLHFVGTSYATDNRAVKTVEPIAQELGVGDLVDEYTGRIPYFEALQTLVESDGIILIGSDDPGYTASKLYPCILARRPILAVFHQQSSVVDILTQCRAGRAVTFNTGSQPQDIAPQVVTQLEWFRSLPPDYQPDTDWQSFQPYTAREMTRQHGEIFDRVLQISSK